MAVKFDTEYFIKKSKLKHGNKFEYELVDYINARTKVKIICPFHGVFKIRPEKHLNSKYGCKLCGSKNGGLAQRSNLKDFITKANVVHGSLYDYSKTKYVKSNFKVSILCNEHGEFHQTPNIHLRGSGCPSCAVTNNTNRDDTFSFISKAKLKHGDVYDYSEVEYINSLTKVGIGCQKHGLIWQRPDAHLSGKGCHLCKSSKGECAIEAWLVGKNITFEREYKFDNCKSKNRLRFDFWIPEKNTVIEFNGIQHYEPVLFFGGDVGFTDRLKRDKIKRNFCEENGITLIVIKYDDIMESELSKTLY